MTPLKPIAHMKTPGHQTTIWPWVGKVDFKSPGQVSPFIGDFCEQYAAQVFCGQRLVTDKRALCPDLEFGPGFYAEVKAIGPRGSLIFHRSRYRKYKRLLSQRKKVLFILIFHDVRAKHIRDTNHLGERLSTGFEQILVFPGQTLIKKVQELEAEHGWRRCNVEREDLQEFIRIPKSYLNNYRQVKSNIWERAFPIQVRGFRVCYVPLRRVRVQLPEQALVGIHASEYRLAAGPMLEELEAGWHDVALTQLQDGRQIRVVQGENVEWYTRLRREHYIGKRGYSLVQRRNIVKCLEAIRDNRPPKGAVEERLLPYMDEWIQDRMWEARA